MSVYVLYEEKHGLGSIDPIAGSEDLELLKLIGLRRGFGVDTKRTTAEFVYNDGASCWNLYVKRGFLGSSRHMFAILEFDDYAQSGFPIDPRLVEHWARVYNIQTEDK